MVPRRLSIPGALCAVLALPPIAWAQGGASKIYDDLLERIPAQANVLVLFDVAGLPAGPMAQRDNWRGMAEQNRPDLLGIHGVATHGAVALGWDLQTMHERWRLGMVQLSVAAPGLEVIASRKGGYVESVANMPVAFTPRGFNLFRLTDNIIGFV